MFEYKFPDIGEGIHEGTLIKWLVKEGDAVKEGQDVAEVETDKVTANIPSAATGTVAKLHAGEGDTIHVGSVFVSIDDGKASASPDPTETAKEENDDDLNVVSVAQTDSEDPDAVANDPVEEETAGVVGEVIASSNEIPPSREGQVVTKAPAEKKKVLATPVARKMAKDLGVDLQTLAGTGPGGRIMKEDIQKAASGSKDETKAEPKPSATPIESTEDTRVEPISRIRKTISQKMSESARTLVHTTSMEEIEVTELVAFREKYKLAFGEETKLTYLPLIIKAIVLGLKQHPILNSSMDEEKGELHYHARYHIGIATDTERGLVVPVMRDADRKSVEELAIELMQIAAKAEENSFALEDIKGGTFSITNYGSIGGSFGTPIINYPESAILGVGRIAKKPVVKDDRIVIGYLLPLSLSYDHRLIDGADALRFIRTIEEALAHPELLLLRS